MSNQDQEKNLAQSLSQLGETTTAAELLRQKGQSRKLRVISEKKLMEWMLLMLQQHMAGKADVFSDIEKSEMLEKAQEEIKRRMKREQEAQIERDQLKLELEQAMSAVAAGSSAEGQAELGMALDALKQKLEQAEQINLDLQQDNYDLQDQLNEKMALLSTTIAEKDKLRETVRHQMMRMTSLCEGVLGIDNDYYGMRHQDENPVSDEATQDEQFYHDFDVGAKVITTLQADLERLRGIVKREEQQATAAEEQQPKALLEADLLLLEQLKSGSLHAVDVAAPVAGLLEAMEGARLEAEAFEVQVAEATGAGHGQVFTELPEEGGDPAVVLAGATAVTRELAASLARNRSRIAALKSIADESDEARNNTELELEAMQSGLERICTTLRQRAEAERLAVPAALTDREAPPEERAAAAAEVVEHLQAAGPVEAAAIEQLALTDRLVKPGSSSPETPPTDKHLMADRLRKAGAELELYTIDLQRQLDQAIARERALSERSSLQAERLAAATRAEEALSVSRSEISRLGGELAAMREELEVAQADASEFRARNEATGTQFSSEVLTLRQELAGLQARHQEQTSALSSLRQQIEASEARLKRQREELNRSLEERDNLIAEKDRSIDQLSSQCIDTKALESKVQGLSKELDAANTRVRELESRTGEQAGAALRTGDLAELHKRTMTERDQLRAQKRHLEGEVADARGSTEELRIELAQLRQVQQSEAESHARALAEERQRTATLTDTLIKLRQDVAGQLARNRKPSDSK